MTLNELISFSASFKDLYKRLGIDYFREAEVTKLEGFNLYAVDFVGLKEKELQILLDLDGNVVGVNRAIWDEEFTELQDYISIGQYAQQT